MPENGRKGYIEANNLRMLLIMSKMSRSDPGRTPDDYERSDPGRTPDEPEV